MPQIPASGIGGKPPSLLTPEGEKSFDALRRGLARNSGFAFYVLIVDSRARDEVERRLRAWSDSPGMPKWRVLGEEAQDQDLLEVIESGRSIEGNSGLVLADFDALLDSSGSKILSALNIARDRLDNVLLGPLVIVVSPEQASELMKRAPDLWDVRAATYEIEAQPVSSLPEPHIGQSLFDYIGLSNTTTPAELRAARARLEWLEQSSEPPPSGALAESWLKLGFGFSDRGELAEAKAAALRAIAIASGSERDRPNKETYTSAIARAELLLGDTELRLGRHREGEENLRHAAERARKVNDTWALSLATSELGVAARMRGALQEARQLLKEAIELQTRTGASTGNSSLHLGQVFLDLDRRRDAERHFRQALQHARKNRSEELAGSALVGLAKIESKRGQNEEALRLLHEGLECYRRSSSDWGSALVSGELGRLYVSQGKYAEAAEHLSRAVDLGRRVGVAANLISDLVSLAYAFSGLERMTEAEYASREAVELARKRHPMGAAEALKVHHDILEALGRPDEASAALAEAKELDHDAS